MRLLAFSLLLLASAAPGSARQSKEPLTVMSFNIRYGTAADGVNQWSARKDHLFEIVRRESADLVGLQEALKFGNTRGDKIDDVFVQPGAEVLRAEILRDSRDNRYPSDHFPVVARVKLASSP